MHDFNPRVDEKWHSTEDLGIASPTLSARPRAEPYVFKRCESLKFVICEHMHFATIPSRSNSELDIGQGIDEGCRGMRI